MEAQEERPLSQLTEEELRDRIAGELFDACTGDGGILRWVINEPQTNEQLAKVEPRWLRLADQYAAYASRIIGRQKPPPTGLGYLHALDRTVKEEGKVGVNEFMRREDVCAYFFRRFYFIAYAIRQGMYGSRDAAHPTLPQVLAIPCSVFALGARDDTRTQFARIEQAMREQPTSGLGSSTLWKVLVDLMPFISAATHFIESVDLTYGSVVNAFTTNMCWRVLFSREGRAVFAVTPLQNAVEDVHRAVADMQIAAANGQPAVIDTRYTSLSSQAVGHLVVEVGEMFQASTGMTFSLPYAHTIKPIILGLEIFTVFPPPGRADGKPFFPNLADDERVQLFWYESVMARFGTFAFFYSDQGEEATKLAVLHMFDNDYSKVLTSIAVEIASSDPRWNPAIDGGVDPWWFVTRSLMFVGELKPRPLILSQLVDDSAPKSPFFPGDLWMGKVLAFVCSTYGGTPEDSFSKNKENQGASWSAFRTVVSYLDNDLPRRVPRQLAQSWVVAFLYYVPDYWPAEEPTYVINSLKALEIVCNRLFGFDVVKTLMVGYDKENGSSFYSYLIDLVARHDFSEETFRIVLPWLFSRGSPTAPSEEWQGLWSHNALTVLGDITLRSVRDHFEARFEPVPR